MKVSKETTLHFQLAEHLFRAEYGKMVAVISKYVGIDSAEDIVQDTLLAAVEYWKHIGIPPNPQAWLYKTAKNKSLNWLRKKQYSKEYQNQVKEQALSTIEFNDEEVADEQLRMMLTCCQPSLSEEVQTTLILKILCGFSISEIAAAFCTNNETINKRLVRGRKKLRSAWVTQYNPKINNNLEVVLQTIYLIFNEGYSPTRKNQVIRKDLCLEAIRLAQIVSSNKNITHKDSTHALIALMYLNCSRFEARLKRGDETIDMEHQDRSLWNQKLLNKGLHHLDEAKKNGGVSKYLVLACISAHHSIAQTFDQTNWKEIVALYDILIRMEDSPLVRLNRIVAFSKVEGPAKAIAELQKLTPLTSSHLYHSTLAALCSNTDYHQAIIHYKKAISLAVTERDRKFLTKKLNALVPISTSHV